MRDVDNAAVRESQIKRLHQLKSRAGQRQGAGCPGGAHRKSRESGEGNLLALAIDAARARATLGEISFALGKVNSTVTKPSFAIR